MRKIIPIFIISIIITILLFAFSSKEIADSKSTTVGYKYTIGEYNGKVAIFHYGEESPETILDCRINSLPDAERKSLKSGIHVNTEAELQHLIEAYD